MEKTKVVFVVFTVMLILGIFIMVKPYVFILQSPTSEKSIGAQVSSEKIVPREVIMLGSALIIVGLVGLSILGFRLFKELMAEANSER